MNEICCRCKMAVSGLCPWIYEGEPLLAIWDCEKTKIKRVRGGYYTSYQISKCQGFVEWKNEPPPDLKKMAQVARFLQEELKITYLAASYALKTQKRLLKACRKKNRGDLYNSVCKMVKYLHEEGFCERTFE